MERFVIYYKHKQQEKFDNTQTLIVPEIGHIHFLPLFFRACGQIMVLIVDGNSELGAHVGNNLWYLICLRHLIISRAVTNQISFSEKAIFTFNARPTCSELPSNMNTMGQIKQIVATFCSFSPN